MRAKPLPPEERRAAIIAAARPLLQRIGPTVSTREVAEAAGIAEGTLFRVFETKDALIDAVLTDVMDPTASCLEIRAISADVALEERIAEVMHILTDRMREITGFFLALRLTPKEQTPEHERERKERHTVNTTMVNDAIVHALGADSSRLRVGATQAAGYIWAVTFVAGHPMIGSELDLSTEAAVEMMLHGMVDAAAPHTRTADDHSTAPPTPTIQTAKAS